MNNSSVCKLRTIRRRLKMLTTQLSIIAVIMYTVNIPIIRYWRNDGDNYTLQCAMNILIFIPNY